jgi:putative DNA primase/helicase
LLTISTGINYDPQVNLKVWTMLLDLLKDIYGTDEMIKYMLQFEAYTLHGSKTEEIIHFWVGKGGNGKGIMLYLFMKALGDYCYCPDVSIFTCSKKSSSAANSEIAKGQGKRLWAMTVPAHGDKFNTSKLKKKSGRNPIQARHLYKQFFEYLDQFVMVFQMNNKSALDSYDEGMVRRLRLIEHKYQFVANSTKPTERQGDKNLKNKISDDEAIREEFMQILIEAHVEVKLKGKAKTPKAVTDYTKSYMVLNNVVGDFLSEYCEVTNSNTDIIKSSDMYQAFKSSHYYAGMNQLQFKEAMVANNHTAEKSPRGGSFTRMWYITVLLSKTGVRRTRMRRITTPSTKYYFAIIHFFKTRLASVC